MIIRPNISTTTLPGFKESKPENMITVVFHALLPSSFWKWDDTSEVYMRFGNDKFGDFKFDCGPMTVFRYACKY